MKAAIALCLLVFVGCSHKEYTPSGSMVVSFREDAPKFKRNYFHDLSKGRTLKVEIEQTSLRSLYPDGIEVSGELDQPGGKWILFSPDEIADKILDRDLVPEITLLCDQIIAEDKAWRESKPSSFTDENGTVWVRQ